MGARHLIEPDVTIAPYGEWRSPISIESTIAGSRGIAEVRLDGDDLLWLESRPDEGGRQALVRRRPDGSTEEVVPGVSVRTRVHEYGGGAYLAAGGTVWYVDFADGRVFERRPGEAPRALTEPASFRYADFALDGRRRRLLCVREDHRQATLEAHGEAVNQIVAIALDAGDQAPRVTVLAGGHDFCAAPRPSPDGSRLAWLTWDHPDMPWDATSLWVGTFSPDGLLSDVRRVPAGDRESLVQPRWSPAGVLHVASDRTGWWNLYRLRATELEAVAPMEAELAHPDWQFGYATYAFSRDGLLAIARRDGRDRLVSIDEATGEVRQYDVPDTEIEWLQASGDRAVYDGAGPDHPFSVVQVALPGGERRVLRTGRENPPDPAYVSMPEPIAFPTADGSTAHALFYPPRNPDFQAPPGELPPVVVQSHGGPTGAASSSLQLGYQLLTSRGIAVVDVDYRGSTGYGRAYREALKGRWGIADVEDCVAAVRFLAERGRIDPARVAIAGGSAGGFTTLAALTFTDTFAAGVSYYGVADLAALARDTHKFESRYLDGLVGPYPEAAETYAERSPIEHTDRLSCPLLILQGLDDRVVPPAQAEQMVAALRARGIPYAYLPFEGEDHGFRRAATLRRSREAELSFYGQVFGFEPADPIEPIELIRTGV